MAPIRTFDFDWPLREEIRHLTCALGTTGPNQWILVITSPQKDEYEPREWCSIAVRSVEDPDPAPSASGNPVIALKNYSENFSLLSRLQNVGMIRHTGRKIKQAYVYLEMVEVLVPRDELIRHCAGCGLWEE